MSRLKKKHHFAVWSQSPVVLLILLGVCIWLGVSVYERYEVEREMAERRINAEQQQAALLERKQQLSERVDELEGERGVESEIRKNFDVKRPGEQVVIILDDKEESEPIMTPTPPSKPWYQFW